MITIIDVDIYK